MEDVWKADSSAFYSVSMMCGVRSEGIRLTDDELVIWHNMPALSKVVHLEDHVHFNHEGYRVWDDELYVDVVSLAEERKKRNAVLL